MRDHSGRTSDPEMGSTRHVLAPSGCMACLYFLMYPIGAVLGLNRLMGTWWKREGRILGQEEKGTETRSASDMHRRKQPAGRSGRFWPSATSVGWLAIVRVRPLSLLLLLLSGRNRKQKAVGSVGELAQLTQFPQCQYEGRGGRASNH